MGLVVQFLYGMLTYCSLEVIPVILVVMVQLKITIGISILKIQLHPTRCNRFFGTRWKAVNKKFDRQSGCTKAAIYISCGDTVAARFAIAEVLTEARNSSPYSSTPRYWMDFGNGKDIGQVVLSTIGKVEQPKSDRYEATESLPFVTDEFSELLRQSDGDDLPSCSLAEALGKQDLFINSTLAQMGCSLLWQLFREGLTTQRGLFLNIAGFRTVPLPV